MHYVARSPRRPRKQNTCPENGSCPSTVCACAARLSNPLRMSVAPAASDTRVPAARPFTQQVDHLPQRLGADLAAQAHPCPTPKRDLDDALANRPPRPTAVRRDRDRHHGAAFDHCFRQQLPPPSEQLVAVHIMMSRHDRHRRSRRLRLRHHLALQRFRILSTLRRARLLLSVH